MEKEEVRRRMRAEKRLHPAEELEMLSRSLCDKLLSHSRIAAADTLLLYWPLPDEVDIRPAAEALAAQGKRTLLPKVASATELTLHPYRTAADLAPGAFGIMEPVTPEVSVSELAERQSLVAVIPGVAFDRFGHRLGRGRGYYDRLLHRLPQAYTLGAGFPFQLLAEIPVDTHDISVCEVLG